MVFISYLPRFQHLMSFFFTFAHFTGSSYQSPWVGLFSLFFHFLGPAYEPQWMEVWYIVRQYPTLLPHILYILHIVYKPQQSFLCIIYVYLIHSKTQCQLAKDWLDHSFLFTRLVWCGKGFPCGYWIWSQGGSQQPFSSVLGHFWHGDTQTNKRPNKKPCDPNAACPWPVRKQSFAVSEYLNQLCSNRKASLWGRAVATWRKNPASQIRTGSILANKFGRKSSIKSSFWCHWPHGHTSQIWQCGTKTLLSQDEIYGMTRLS